ncbi:MAG: hypothetical protein J5651_00350 [Salinivirgaceae bacterium]|nr:hypothetical protein [Salinivirgaceae bacterium]
MRVNKLTKSQSDKGKDVREWLIKGKPLTQLEASQKFDVLHLAGVISKMRKKGYGFKVDKVVKPDGYTYARYQVISLPTDKTNKL